MKPRNIHRRQRFGAVRGGSLSHCKMRKYIACMGALLLALAAAPGARGATASVPEGWKTVTFHGHTRYRHDSADGCWRADAHASASGLVREKPVDLTQTPWLHWAWRAPAIPDWPDRSERIKSGDDFLTRVYVIKKGWLPWQTRAINYVWSRSQPVGSHWHNPFAGEAMMVVVQGPGGAGHWHDFTRNVAADFKRFWSMDVKAVDAVAVMTDTDNTGVRARACYRLPAFSASPPSAGR